MTNATLALNDVSKVGVTAVDVLEAGTENQRKSEKLADGEAVAAT